MVSGAVHFDSREKLLEAASNLMLDRGYNGATVGDICEMAQVSEGNFYSFFHTKEALGLEVLEYYCQSRVGKLLEGPFMQEEDPMLKLLGFLNYAEERAAEFWGQGCLLATFALELASTDSQIGGEVTGKFDEFTQVLSELFAPLAALSNCDQTALELAKSYLVALEGSIVMAKVFNDPQRISEGLATYRKHLMDGVGGSDV